MTKRPDEILTSIAVPAADGWRSSYWKLRRRGAFDCPVAAALLKGETLSDDAIEVAAGGVAKPVDNTDVELVWRKKMVRALVANALSEVRGDDMRARRHQLARQEVPSPVSVR